MSSDCYKILKIPILKVLRKLRRNLLKGEIFWDKIDYDSLDQSIFSGHKAMTLKPGLGCQQKTSYEHNCFPEHLSNSVNAECLPHFVFWQKSLITSWISQIIQHLTFSCQKSSEAEIHRWSRTKQRG